MPKSSPSIDYVQCVHELETFASYPALPLAQNMHKFYIVTIPVEDIFPFCFVIRRQEDPIKGFQRNLSQERARDISEYLDNSRGSIPTNIVLSAQGTADLTYNTRSKTLRYKRTQKSFLVLDGQHRLFGYGMTKKKHRVPVAIYEGLTRTEEASLFIDINTNQRGVPAALLIDIKEVAQRESVKDREFRRIFDELNRDADSPLNGLLSPASSASGKISRVTFNRAMDDIVDNTVVRQLSQEAQYKLIKNYFKSVENSISSPKLISKSAYFEAFCHTFNEVIKLAKAIKGNFKYESLCEILAPIKNIDLEHITAGGNVRISKTHIIPILSDVMLPI
jgi:DNA sulfur modification protein DndB